MVKKVELQFFGNSFSFMQTGVVLITNAYAVGQKSVQNEATLRVDVGESVLVRGALRICSAICIF